MNDPKLAWDDLRIVMTIARAGSLSDAARALKVSHATMFRRLAQIEERVGVKLFKSSRGRYAPSPAGNDIFCAAELIESEILAVERKIAGRDLETSGTVRITTTDTLLCGLLTPILARFRTSYPAISVKITTSNRQFDLSRRQADVAIRPTTSPPQTLIGLKVGMLAHAIYAAKRSPTMRFVDVLAEEWIGWDDKMRHPSLDEWMRKQDIESRCHYYVNTVSGLLEAVREGVGITVLPCYLADHDSTLFRVGDPIPELATDLWLLTHPDSRNICRVRVFVDFVAKSVRALHKQLMGQLKY